jgi:hypothetical protein
MADLEIFNALVQGSPEWLAERAGLPTASEASTLLVKGKGPHGLGAGAVTYAHEVAGELLTGQAAPSFTSAATERGHEMEGEIRSYYELLNGVSVDEVGFMRRGRAGYSPDGLVGDDGLFEAKSHAPKKLIGMIINGGVPKDHRAQLDMGLLVSGRAWIDLTCYWPGIEPHVVRHHAEEKALSEMSDALERFNAYVDEVVDHVRNREAA